MGHIYFLRYCICQGNGKKEPDKNSAASSKSTVQGCCRIKMTGGGYDYFISTEEDCASHRQFHSFLKERTLCFESFPE
ncbi:hypothetical protein LEP1GSC064_4175 [Leptospira kirschneri serovar Grippotyphosa str. Moskva]|nr:hypothetical protein LEP1GSC064_4175 [Leptospira kirschneri serovar Grippotyphosa str. Moskva]